MDQTHGSRPGWIEVITGSMFSGKSEELIRRLRRAQIARQRVQIFKPVIDDRYSEFAIVSHSEMKIPSESVATAAELKASVLPESSSIWKQGATAAAWSVSPSGRWRSTVCVARSGRCQTS